MQMHGSLLNRRERTGAGIAVVLVHLLLAALVLSTQGQVPQASAPAQPPIEIFDVPPPVPPPPPPPTLQPELAPDAEGAASAPNRLSEATPVVAPEPVIPVPRETPMVSSETPASGSEATQGAAPDPGPGTGAGGAGEGTGSGGAGDGSGGGGLGGSRPRVLSGQFRTRHYPSSLQKEWETAGPVLVIFDVQLNGRAKNCRVYRSSGSDSIDRETCRLVEQRLRLRPATDEQGRPRVEAYGYQQQRTR